MIDTLLMSKNCWTPDTLSAIKQHLSYAQQHSPFYQNLLAGIEIDSINQTTFHQIPITKKSHLHSQEKAFLAVDQHQIVDYVTTSGTTGEPVTFMLTDGDLERLATNEMKALQQADISADDVIQIMVTLDKRFMAGLAYYLGARKLGAGVIRSGVESILFQIDTMKRFRPSVLIGVPSFILKVLRTCHVHEEWSAIENVKKIVCIGEPIRRPDFSYSSLGTQLTQLFDGTLHGTYASTEIATAFTECTAGCGGHHIPSLSYCEVVDEEGRSVAPGDLGELVVTPFHVQGMPLVRFATGDLCRLYESPCVCGRPTIRLGPIEGRKQQMIKYKGTTLYPPAIFELLDQEPLIDDYVLILSKDQLGQDQVLIEFVAEGADFKLLDRLQDSFKAYLRVSPSLQKVDRAHMRKRTLQPLARKKIKLIDLRHE